MKKIVIALAVFTLIACNNSKKEEKETIKIGQNTQNKTDKQTPLEESIDRGAIVYQDFCVQCHLSTGKGVPGNFPPLAGSNWLTEKRTESIHAVKYGQKGEIQVNGVTYNGVMTPMGLSDEEVADVLNYSMNSWGNTQEEMVTEEEVSKVSK